MEHLPARTLPRLMLDTVHCLVVAHDHVDDVLRSETRNTITSLRATDMTNIERATSALRGTASHLRDVEANLKARNRSLTARKIREVRERVLFMTSSYDAEGVH